MGLVEMKWGAGSRAQPGAQKRVGTLCNQLHERGSPRQLPSSLRPQGHGLQLAEVLPPPKPADGSAASLLIGGG